MTLKSYISQTANRNKTILILFAFLFTLICIRGYWTPDEPDFAQCVKEMRLRGAWLFPWLNGEIYTEKPILFYWIMKTFSIVGEYLSFGAGFDRGIAPWALRLPSVLSSVGFLVLLHVWARRFLDEGIANLAMLVLATTPIWLWQSQFIQIDMLFSVLVAGSWICWISGYSILRGQAIPQTPSEARRWFLAAYALLGLAVLTKGPLALVLSAGVVGTFLTARKDWQVLRGVHPLSGLLVFCAIVLPWYFAAGWKGGASYVYAMVIHQNFERALEAWDHIQPWWRYFSYLAADFFPWCLLLPFAAVAAFREWRRLGPAKQFAVIAWAVPFLLLSVSKSKQGKYLLMAYPFLALTVVFGLKGLAEVALRRIRTLLALAFSVPGAALLLVGLAHMGGRKLQLQLLPYLGPVRLLGLVLLGGGIWLWMRRGKADFPSLVGETAGILALAFLLALPWTYLKLDPVKSYREWARHSEPYLEGRRAFFWGDIRSGAMIYSDHYLPVLATPTQLKDLQPGDRLVATRRRWKTGIHGLDESTLKGFRVVYEQPQGGDGLMILTPMEPAAQAALQ